MTCLHRHLCNRTFLVRTIIYIHCPFQANAVKAPSCGRMMPGRCVSDSLGPEKKSPDRRLIFISVYTLTGAV